MQAARLLSSIPPSLHPLYPLFPLSPSPSLELPPHPLFFSRTLLSLGVFKMDVVYPTNLCKVALGNYSAPTPSPPRHQACLLWASRQLNHPSSKGIDFPSSNFLRVRVKGDAGLLSRPN